MVFAILLTGDVQHVLGFVQYHNVLLRLTSGLTGLAAVAALVLMFLPASNAYLRPPDGRAGLFGSMFGPRTARAVAQSNEPAAAAEPELLAEPAGSTEPGDAAPAVDLTKADLSTGQPAVSTNRPADGPPVTRRPPRAKSRRQPTE